MPGEVPGGVRHREELTQGQPHRFDGVVDMAIEEVTDLGHQVGQASHRGPHRAVVVQPRPRRRPGQRRRLDESWAAACSGVDADPPRAGQLPAARRPDPGLTQAWEMNQLLTQL